MMRSQLVDYKKEALAHVPTQEDERPEQVINWPEIAREAASFFVTTPVPFFMYGPLDITEKQRKLAQRQEKGPVGLSYAMALTRPAAGRT
jgi:hypothetical protein